MSPVAHRPQGRLAPLSGSVPAPGGRIKEDSRCRGFETSVRYLKPGQITETVINTKKDREFRVLEGECFIELFEPEDSRLVRLLPGECIFVPADVGHRIVTITSAANVIVTQAYKYDVAMEETEPPELSDVVVRPQPAQEEEEEVITLQPLNTNPSLPARRPRGMQKAASQMAALFEDYKPNAVPLPPPAVVPEGGQVQVNQRATGGAEFDQSGAG
jgi:mannose-6-phosphate isomerase-like protein (cupin superfamily)